MFNEVLASLDKLGYPQEISYKTIQDIESELIDVDGYTVERFHKLILSLEQDTDVRLCLRGDSRIAKIFEVQYLKKFFIVGQKADVFNCVKPTKEKYSHFKKKHEELCKEIVELIKESNHIVKKKNKSNKNLVGNITITSEKLKRIKSKNLNQFKILLISFLHNNGFKDFKKTSPFLSLTIGDSKFSTATHFALNKNPKQGYIFLYCLPLKAEFMNYVITKKLIDFLNGIGINWYEDRHNEVMLLNGMYPHYLFGIYQIDKNKMISNFVMNPSLYKLLKNNEDFDCINGLMINQKNFLELCKEVGYQNVYFTNGNRTYVSDLSKTHIVEVTNIKLG